MFVHIIRSFRRKIAAIEDDDDNEYRGSHVIHDHDDDDTDDEAEAKERLKRKENELFFIKLKENILRKLGFSGENDDLEGVPEGFFYDAQFHSEKFILVRKYLQYISMPSVTVLNYEPFNNFMILIIILAGLNVGIQTYPSMENEAFVVYLDNFILAMFMLEAILKIFAEGLRPYRFFYGPEWAWNNFDFLIIFFSLPLGLFDGGKSIQMLRLIRLARLGKLIKKIPALAVIVAGLVGGLQSVAYIMMLLFLVFYMYGIIGYYLFGITTPFHFGSLLSALIILWRVTLMDNWSNIMYSNIFGCNSYLGEYVPDWQRNTHNKMLWCTSPGENTIASPIFFISFVVISSFVMLSLFIGAITNSMGDNMEILKEEQKARQAEANKQRNLGKMQANSAMRKAIADKIEAKKRRQKEEEERMKELSGEIVDDNVSPENREMKRQSVHVSIERVIVDSFEEPQEDVQFEETEMTKVLKVALGDVKAKDDYHAEERILTNFQKIKFYYEKWGDLCMWVAMHPRFVNFVTFVIILAGLNVGAQSDLRLQRLPIAMKVMDILDEVILAVFTLEIVLKLFGEKLRTHRFFISHWNKFDFFIVVASFVPGVGSGVTVLRLLRLLRVLKLVKSLPQLAVIINALINGIASIGYIGVILFLVFYVFSILGLILFGENDPWHYGYLHLTLINLFRVATLDNTNAIMYTNMFGCDVGGYTDIYLVFPELCTSPSNSPFLGMLYHTVFVTLAAQILLTLFIGIISTSMEEAKEAKIIEMQKEQELADYAAETGLTNIQIEAFKEVFEMLDLDGEGIISDEELKIGLGSIDMHLSEEEITEITDLVDPKNVGLDLVKFIRFMFKTPKYAPGAAAASIAWKLKQKEARKTKKSILFYIWRWFVSRFPFLEVRDEELEHEAALILQDAWRRKLATREAQQEIERKKAEQAEHIHEHAHNESH